MKSLRPPDTDTKIRGLRRDVEILKRRDMFSGLVETAAVWGHLVRDGAPGTWSISSGALNATTTLVPHNIIAAESGVDCDIVASPTRITILESGLYLIRSSISDADGGGSDYGWGVGYGFNGTGAVWATQGVARRTLNGFLVTTSISFAELDPGDYITQVVGQNSGSTKTLQHLATLTVVRIPGSISTAEGIGEIDGGSP